MLKNKLFKFILVTISLFKISFYSFAMQTNSDSDPITIAVSAPLTGTLSGVGLQIKAGVLQ